MTTAITILLLLAGVAWAAWRWYGQYWWAARKWEKEVREAVRRLHDEKRKARELHRAKDLAEQYSAAGVQKRAEELKRQRDGESSIYDDMRDTQDETLRKLCKRRFDIDNMPLNARIDEIERKRRES